MALFQRLFFAVLLAGLISGAALAALHQWRTVPLIVAAETYEAPMVMATTEEAGAAMAHEEQAWTPADGLERSGFTVAADLFAALGFAFVLAAASMLTGIDVTARNGALWGLAGLAVFTLAPSLGLAPGLPGMPVADVTARQIWWAFTALAAATAIFAIVRFRNPLAIVVAIALLVAPHIVGAPQPPAEPSSVPPQLSSSFTATSMIVSAAFWMILGPLYGFVFERLARPTASKAVTA